MQKTYKEWNTQTPKLILMYKPWTILNYAQFIYSAKYTWIYSYSTDYKGFIKVGKFFIEQNL